MTTKQEQRQRDEWVRQQERARIRRAAKRMVSYGPDVDGREGFGPRQESYLVPVAILDESVSA